METATPEPKDVVLVIDNSGLMITAVMNVAKEAEKTVLSTMNPKDGVSTIKTVFFLLLLYVNDIQHCSKKTYIFPFCG